MRAKNTPRDIRKLEIRNEILKQNHGLTEEQINREVEKRYEEYFGHVR